MYINILFHFHLYLGATTLAPVPSDDPLTNRKELNMTIMIAVYLGMLALIAVEDAGLFR